jgi:hypothetical protein
MSKVYDGTKIRALNFAMIMLDTEDNKHPGTLHFNVFKLSPNKYPHAKMNFSCIYAANVFDKANIEM